MKVEMLGTFGDDLMVVNGARISYDRWSDALTPKDEALIRHLAEQGHNSPFYHPQAQFRITAPFYVAAQLKRHHVGLAINEVSRRYTKSEPEYELPEVWRRVGGEHPNPQVGGSDGDEWLQRFANDHVEYAIGQCKLVYALLIGEGVAPEQARAVLPLATLTTWLWTGSLFAYAKMCRERLAPDAQPETRDVAVRIYDCMAEAFPVSWAALTEVHDAPNGA